MGNGIIKLKLGNGYNKTYYLFINSLARTYRYRMERISLTKMSISQQSKLSLTEPKKKKTELQLKESERGNNSCFNNFCRLTGEDN